MTNQLTREDFGTDDPRKRSPRRSEVYDVPEHHEDGRIACRLVAIAFKSALRFVEEVEEELRPMLEEDSPDTGCLFGT